MKRNKKFIAVTGGIGSGKSTVLSIIEKEGYPVFSADKIAKDIYFDKKIFSAVSEAFPQCIADGKIDRAVLAQLVFSNENNLQKLNEITHPTIMNKLYTQMNKVNGPIVFAEVPLLFENGLEKDFDLVLVVKRNMKDRIRSVMERDSITEEKIHLRIKNQFDYEKNEIFGHTVIYNDGDISSLKIQIDRVLNEFCK